MSNYYITHFFNTTLPDKNVLKPLTILTATRESISNNEFFFGYRGTRKISREEIQNEINTGAIIEIPNAQLSTEDKGLWIDNSGNIFLASIKNPFKDDLKISVYKLSTQKKIKSIFENYMRRLPAEIHEFH